MSSEKYNLSWNDFERSSSNAFRELLSENEFTDVTLATQDEKQIIAHKVILSAGSVFLRKILLKNPHQHPLLYLKGINFDELSLLVKFIYLGEFEVSEDKLSLFLKAAKELQINGLDEKRNAIETKQISDIPNTFFEKIDHRSQADDAHADSSQVDGSQAGLVSENSMVNEYYSESDEYFAGEEPYEEPDMFLPSKETEVDRKWACDKCDYATSQSGTLSRHKKTKHQGLRYSCNWCDTQYAYPGNLRIHLKREHSNLNVNI